MSTTSTRSPSSKSASDIGVSGFILSPSIMSLGRFVLVKPARFKNAATIAPQVVVGRTVIVTAVEEPERTDSLKVSSLSPTDGESAFDSEPEISSIWGDRERTPLTAELGGRH